MLSALTIPLTTNDWQAARLAELQTVFAQACNALVPVVRERRCWNRVALHHLAYHDLRQAFPHLGSQMVCNAIYSVSRVCRLLFQHPASPWHLSRLGDRPLPMLEFHPTAPVYFDRHTLSLKRDGLSMYTLDGRMHFALRLPPEAMARFGRDRLREVALLRQAQGYCLTFQFGNEGESTGQPHAELPEYILVREVDTRCHAVKPEPSAQPEVVS